MGYSTDQQHVQHPAMRISTFGEFTLERLIPSRALAAESPRYERVAHEEWHSRGPAKTVLKVLLCRVRRRVTKDELLEVLWPEDEEVNREHALDSTVSVLRKVLRTHNGVSLLTTSRREGVTVFNLPSQECLWVDADAFTCYIDQATRAERSGEDSLPFWEAAHALVTGEFLEDDLYSAWAQGHRQTINAARHRCLYRLADLYTAREMVDQAETVLHLFLVDDPTDEDALCRLMLLLEQQGRYQEACHLYEQTARVLDEELHTTPMPRTRALAEHLRSALGVPLDATTRAFAHLPQMPDSYSSLPNEAASLAVSLPYAPSMWKTPYLTTSRRQVLQAMLSAACTALVLPPQELLNPDTWERLAMVSKKPSSIDTFALDDLETITKRYWRLRANIASSDLLSGVLGHFETVIQVMQHPQPTALFRRLCAIVSETAQIIGQMLFDMQEYPSAWSYYSCALHAAQEAHNADLRAVGMGRMSFLLTYSDQAQEALPLLQEAQNLVRQSTFPMNRSWLAVVEAEAHAHLLDADACKMALDEAELLATQHGFGADPYATGLNPSRLAGYKGVCFVRLHQPEVAVSALQKALALLPPHSLRRQSMLLTDMAAAHLQQGAIEQTIALAGQALVITAETRSRSVLQRLRNLRHDLEPWKMTPLVSVFDEQMAVLLVSLRT